MVMLHKGIQQQLMLTLRQYYLLYQTGAETMTETKTESHSKLQDEKKEERAQQFFLSVALMTFFHCDYYYYFLIALTFTVSSIIALSPQLSCYTLRLATTCKQLFFWLKKILSEQSTSYCCSLPFPSRRRRRHKYQKNVRGSYSNKSIPKAC